jgi:hypothetical protein
MPLKGLNQQLQINVAYCTMNQNNLLLPAGTSLLTQGLAFNIGINGYFVITKCYIKMVYTASGVSQFVQDSDIAVSWISSNAPANMIVNTKNSPAGFFPDVINMGQVAIPTNDMAPGEFLCRSDGEFYLQLTTAIKGTVIGTDRYTLLATLEYRAK